MNDARILELEKNTFYLNGLNCANCAAKIEEAMNKNSQFEAVNFSFATKKLQLKSDLDKTKLQRTLQELIDGIEEGIIVDPVKAVENPIECNDGSCLKQEEVKGHKFSAFLKANTKMVIGTILVFALILIKPSLQIALPAYVIAYVLIGGDVAKRAFANLVKGRLFDEYFLMTLATLGAFALGEYTEAVMVMFFYKIGEGFQDYAVDYSRRSIQSLLNIKAEYANLVLGDRSEKVAPEALHIHDHIVIKAGEKIPVDGIIIEGSSSLDTSALTGESMPRSVGDGEAVLSGAINKTGVLIVEVTKTYENSTVARILDLVENATGKKAKTEQFITKFAKIYTPIVVVSALILAFLPPLLGMGDFREWTSRALIFLVISCPCALVLSVPLGYFGGLGMASRQGILIKGGNYLEALNQIDTFVFDKTGTLTKGNFRVESITGETTLELAVKLEMHSTHPIAKSIMETYGKEVELSQVSDIKELSGQGLSGFYKGQLLLVGNEGLMNRFNIKIEAAKAVGTVVYVAYAKDYVGAIYIADQIKEDAYHLVKGLKAIGAKELVMLTGDQNKIAEHVAGQLGMDLYHSELMPEDKLRHVEALIEKGGKVLFVGDGINDAPVLARADIGVAMGGLGSDAAIEAADIVLMTDEPTKLIEAKAIAKKTRRIILQNIVFALSVKAFFLILGAFGIATMYEAIFADVGVAIIAVLNSMRIMRK